MFYSVRRAAFLFDFFARTDGPAIAPIAFRKATARPRDTVEITALVKAAAASGYARQCPAEGGLPGCGAGFRNSRASGMQIDSAMASK